MTKPSLQSRLMRGLPLLAFLSFDLELFGRGFGVSNIFQHILRNVSSTDSSPPYPHPSPSEGRLWQLELGSTFPGRSETKRNETETAVEDVEDSHKFQCRFQDADLFPEARARNADIEERRFV